MADRDWRGEDPRRYRPEGSAHGERGGEGRWFRDQESRRSQEPERSAGARSNWHDQGDGHYARPETGRGGSRPAPGRGAPDAHYGQYAGSQYGGVSSQGRGYPESDVMPRRGDWSPRQSDDPRDRQGSGSAEPWRNKSSADAGRSSGATDAWRGSGSSGRDNRSGGEPSWGGSGSYGRSQGAGNWGGGTGSEAWQTGGGNGGSTTFGPRESYLGRGPKGYTRSDDRIREDVSERLADDPTVDASDITVAVQSGEVTLTGTVNSRDQKRRAEDCIDNVSGVREVINHLRLRRMADPSGSETLTASEQSSSVLGLGGQPSREDDDTPVTQETANRGGKRSGTTTGSSGGVS